MTSIRTLIIDRPDRWEDFGEYIDTRLFVEGCHKKGWKVACLGGSHPEYDACVGELDSSHIKAELAADIKSLSWTLFPDHNNRLATICLSAPTGRCCRRVLTLDFRCCFPRRTGIFCG